MIQALVVMYNPEFDPNAWQTYLVSIHTLRVTREN